MREPPAVTLMKLSLSPPLPPISSILSQGRQEGELQAWKSQTCFLSLCAGGESHGVTSGAAIVQSVIEFHV